MTPEAQRIAIAEACGFDFRDESWRYPEGEDWQKFMAVYWRGGFVGLARPEWVPVPDYLNDLNAMAEAEEVLTSDQRASFERHLHKMCYPDYGRTWLSASPLSMFPLIHATAAQRAEAFLRTLGKWEEGK